MPQRASSVSTLSMWGQQHSPDDQEPTPWALTATAQAPHNVLSRLVADSCCYGSEGSGFNGLPAIVTLIASLFRQIIILIIVLSDVNLKSPTLISIHFEIFGQIVIMC